MADDRPLDWFSIDEVAEKCRRDRGTILNLISRYQLPRRRLWVVKNKLRRRVIFLSPETARWLQRITLDGEDPKRLQRPRPSVGQGGLR